MNHDSEAIQRSFLKLLQELIPDVSTADVEAALRELEPTDDDIDHQDSVNLLSSSVDNSGISGQGNADPSISQKKSSLEFGETPAVQDRFYALLKRRLETEIQRNPPLFPWESELHDYEASSRSPVGSGAVSQAGNAAANKVPAWLWSNQLQTFNLPVAVPDAVLAQLFQQCREVVHSALLDGVKLVRAVEGLFPEQTQVLNHLAGMVITSPARSGTDASQLAEAGLPRTYEDAVPTQQMVLSLLAAREILGALTLTVSPSQPTVERQWLTELGGLTLRAEYEPGQVPSKLRVEGTFPCGGSMTLRGNGLQAIAQRPDAGALSAELLDQHLNQLCTLEIRFAGQEQDPLVFAIRLASAQE